MVHRNVITQMVHRKITTSIQMVKLTGRHADGNRFMLTVRGRYINGLQKDMLVVYRKVNWIKQRNAG